jgi:hypothetical protein
VNGRDRVAHVRLVAAYRQGLGLAAIAVISGPHGVRIVAGADAEEDKIDTAECLQARWWCRGISNADDIAAAATARLRRRSSEATADAASHAGETVLHAARQRNVDLHTDADIAAHAETAIARIDTELEQLRRAGDLRSVNKSYQAYRLEAASRGERVTPYAQWMLSYREVLVRQLAATLRFL